MSFWAPYHNEINTPVEAATGGRQSPILLEKESNGTKCPFFHFWLRVSWVPNDHNHKVTQPPGSLPAAPHSRRLRMKYTNSQHEFTRENQRALMRTQESEDRLSGGGLELSRYERRGKDQDRRKTLKPAVGLCSVGKDKTSGLTEKKKRKGLKTCRRKSCWNERLNYRKYYRGRRGPIRSQYTFLKDS